MLYIYIVILFSNWWFINTSLFGSSNSPQYRRSFDFSIGENATRRFKLDGGSVGKSSVNQKHAPIQVQVPQPFLCLKFIPKTCHFGLTRSPTHHITNFLAIVQTISHLLTFRNIPVHLQCSWTQPGRDNMILMHFPLGELWGSLKSSQTGQLSSFSAWLDLDWNIRVRHKCTSTSSPLHKVHQRLQLRKLPAIWRRLLALKDTDRGVLNTDFHIGCD